MSAGFRLFSQCVLPFCLDSGQAKTFPKLPIEALYDFPDGTLIWNWVKGFWEDSSKYGIDKRLFIKFSLMVEKNLGLTIFPLGIIFFTYRCVGILTKSLIFKKFYYWVIPNDQSMKMHDSSRKPKEETRLSPDARWFLEGSRNPKIVLLRSFDWCFQSRGRSIKKNCAGTVEVSRKEYGDSALQHRPSS